MPSILRLACVSLLALAPVSAGAQGPWGGPNWPGPGRHGWAEEAAPDPSSEVSVSVFRAVGAEGLLGHGPLRIVPMAGTDNEGVPMAGTDNAGLPMARAGGDGVPLSDAEASSGPAPHDGDPFALESGVFQDAIAARLGHDGYVIAPPGDAAAVGQILELRVSHGLVTPGDPPHKTVSGEAAMGVSNRGSGMSLGIAIDLTKPRGPVVSTRVDVRIRDAATGRALWEGRADMAAREGDGRWPDAKIAARLAGALFDRFPGWSGERRGRK